MEQSDIHVFVEVVEAQSFAKAASRLRMPPATVSLKIARLEKHLGTTLIQRTTRKLNVTLAGEHYYEHCVRALNEMREARRELAATSDEPAGHLRIATTPVLAHSFLPYVIDRYITQYKQVSVDLTLTNPGADLIGEGMDLAVRCGCKTLADSSMIFRKLTTVHFGIWASRAYVERSGMPKSFDELLQLDFISATLPDFPIDFVRAGNKKMKLPRARIHSDDLQAACHLIQHGCGFGFLPNAVGHANGLVRLLPEFRGAEVMVYLIYPSQKFIPPTVRKFIDCATDYFKEIAN